MTYTLDWSETDLGGTAVVSYGSGAILDFTDKPSGATSALSVTSHQADGVDNIVAEFSIETSGSSVMTFDYKVSTESGWDKFHIDVDGVSQANYSGTVAWTTHSAINIASAGVHTIRFRYTKDSGGAGNADRVWVALLNITNTVTVNDASGTVDTYDMEDGAVPSFVTTSTWTNSTSEPIAGSRSLRSPASPANSGSYDLTITKPLGALTSGYAAVGFDFKVSTESGWDKLWLFPDAGASNVPGSGSPSTAGESGWLDWSGSTSGRLAVILPEAESSILLRYTKDGGGAGGSDAVWIDNLDMPAAGGVATDLTAADSAHSHAAESPTLTQTHVTAPADSFHGHTTDAATLTQAHALAPADSAHSHATDAAAVTQAHALAPVDTAHAHAADAPTLTQVHALAPVDSVHGHAAESPVLTQSGDLAAADSTHAHASDSPTLTQTHILAPADSVHGHSSESPTLTSGTTLQPADSVHGSTSDTPAVTQLHLLSPARTVHAHAANLAALTQAHQLAALDSLLTHRSDSPTLSSFEPSGSTPVGRIYVVPAESRTLVVPAENRTTVIPADSRTITT